MDRHAVTRRLEEHFEGVWRQGDFWELESSDFERAKYERQLVLLGDRRYGRVLEVGCGAGAFTQQLATLAQQVVGFDVAPSAIERARARMPPGAPVDFRVADVMTFDPRSDGPWDLVVMSETIYCLGWLYPVFDVAWKMSELFDATAPGGRLLMANTMGGETDYLQLPWLIRTYRDLCGNIGYGVAREEIFSGVKNGVVFETLITLFEKPPCSTALVDDAAAP